MPKDIYLLMRPELIRATLKGQKWQTRRVAHVKELTITRNDYEPILSPGETRPFHSWHISFRRNPDTCRSLGPQGISCSISGVPGTELDARRAIGALYSPYGQPGDLAVVRESFRIGKSLDHLKPSDAIAQAREVGYGETIGPVWYEADGKYRRWGDDDLGDFGGKGKLRGPYEMPRLTARIVRPITEIRVERVAEISEADAIAEGLTRLTKDGGHTYKWGIPDRDGLPGNDDDGWHWKQWEQDPRQAYRRLWNSINAAPKPRYGRVDGKRAITHYEAFPWSAEDFDAMFSGAREAGTWKSKPLHVHANPWVWCISYERREEAPR